MSSLDNKELSDGCSLPRMQLPKGNVTHWGLPMLTRGREHCTEVDKCSDGSKIDLSSKKKVVNETLCVPRRPDQSDITLITYKR